MQVVLTEKDNDEIRDKWFISLADRLIVDNKNILAVVIGETGSGKSLSAISLAYHLEKTVAKRLKELGKTDAIINPETIHDRVALSTKQFLEIADTEKVVDGKKIRYVPKHLKKGNFVVFDEMGAGEMDNQSWQTNVAKAINHVFITFRSDNIGVIMTVPYKEWINKKIRQLIHYTFETVDILYHRRRCVLKPKASKNNYISGEGTSPYLKVSLPSQPRKKVKLVRIFVDMPPARIRNIYHQKKDEFNFDKKQMAKKEIDDMEMRDDRIPRISEERINEVVNELISNLRAIGSLREGKWSINKDVIIGLYKCHPKDAITIKALVQLKANK
jgi:ABC-type dipeptide/oligopeptide/nickel transport system ATPase component